MFVSNSVCTEQGSAEFRTPLCNPGYAPAYLTKNTSGVKKAWPRTKTGLAEKRCEIKWAAKASWF